MKRNIVYIILFLAIILAVIPLIVIAWISFGYVKYGTFTKQACQGYDWWEDEAQCAAEFALEKNDPRYCRINLFGEIGDVCALIYAEKTTDSSTCQRIDLLAAQNKCQQRFE